MVSDRPQSSDSPTVIMFRPRPRGKIQSTAVIPQVRNCGNASRGRLQPGRQNVEPDDHRHRMTINVLGLTFCIALAAAGVWLVNEIVDARHFQDCVLSGRTDCLPLKTLVHNG